MGASASSVAAPSREEETKWEVTLTSTSRSNLIENMMMADQRVIDFYRMAGFIRVIETRHYWDAVLTPAGREHVEKYALDVELALLIPTREDAAYEDRLR